MRSSLAWYIATSASCSSRGTESVCSGCSATPMLVSTCRVMPSRWNGSASTSRIAARPPRAPPPRRWTSVQQHRELVAAEPGDRVLGPDGAGQPGGGDLEQPVAGVVAEGVVDLLEPVEVEQEQRHRRARSARASAPASAICGDQQLAVRQPGQGVVQGRVLLLQRDGRGLVDEEQRQQEQRDQLPGRAGDDHDERRQREHGEGGDGVVADVVDEVVPPAGRRRAARSRWRPAPG